MQSNHDPGEGPSNAVPRYHLGRSNHRNRLSLVSDIETVEPDTYIHNLRPVSSILSVETQNSSILQYTPPGTADGGVLRTRSLNSLSNPWGSRHTSIPNLPAADEADDNSQFGKVSILRTSPFRHSDSAHTESSYGAIDTEGPTIVPTLSAPPRAVPPPIPIKDQKRPTVQRSLSAQTASSYAMYTPRSPGKMVRFSSDDEKRAIPGEDDVPPLPPHAMEALTESKIKSKPLSPHFFHGPPPLHGDEAPPPDYATEKTARTDDGEGGPFGEKSAIFDPEDSKNPWYKRRKGFCFWLILGLAVAVIVFGIIVGVVVGLKVARDKKKDSTFAPSTNATGDFPAPSGFLGTWSFSTKLTEASSACAPAPAGAAGDLWRCYPYQAPPSTDPATWSFVISGDGSETQNVDQLFIASTNNPFTLNFAPQQLNLTRYLTNAYYSFRYEYTKNSILAFNNSVATCEFPNSVLTGQLYVNNTIFSASNPTFAAKARSKTDNRGQWPGNFIIQEEKIGGGGQIVCRDRATQNVLNLGSLTVDHGQGNCLCGYQSF